MARERQDLIVVDATSDDAVELDGRKSGSRSRFQPCQNLMNGKAHIVHAAKDRVIERVEADRHAVQSRVGQQARLAGKQ